MSLFFEVMSNEELLFWGASEDSAYQLRGRIAMLAPLKRVDSTKGFREKLLRLRVARQLSSLPANWVFATTRVDTEKKGELLWNDGRFRDGQGVIAGPSADVKVVISKGRISNLFNEDGTLQEGVFDLCKEQLVNIDVTLPGPDGDFRFGNAFERVEDYVRGKIRGAAAEIEARKRIRAEDKNGGPQSPGNG